MRYYSNEVGLEVPRDSDALAKLEFNLKLYGFEVGLKEIQTLLNSPKEIINLTEKITSYDKPDTLVKVLKVFINERETLKLIVCSNGAYAFVNKMAKPVSLGFFIIPWDNDSFCIFDKIRDGVYLVVTDLWSRGQKIAFLTDAMNKEDLATWKELFNKWDTKRSANADIQEVSCLSRTDILGEVTTTMLKGEMARLDKTLEDYKVLEKHEKELRDTALSTVIATPTKITFPALDEHTYSIEVEKDIQWDMKVFENFIYRHRYYWNRYDKESLKSTTLFYKIMEVIQKLKVDWVKLSVDKRPAVKLSFKRIENKKNQTMLLSYIEDKRVANDDVNTTLMNYFYSNKKLDVKEKADTPKEDLESLKKLKEQRDSEVVNHGIRGYLEDLEGDCPINIGFEKDGSRWNLTIGELKIHLKGGLATIKSLERVLRGSTQSYVTKHSTEEMFNRLSKVLTKEEAMDVIKTAKELGKLCKAIGGKKEDT